MYLRYVGKDTWAGSLSKYSIQSVWFEKFSMGCLKIMGKVTKRNLSISIPDLLECVCVLEEWNQVQKGRKKI